MKKFSERVTPIKEQSARKVYQHFLRLLRMSDLFVRPIGSTMKQPVSGDIDLAAPLDRKEVVHSTLCDNYPNDYNAGTRVASYLVDYKEGKSTKYVQVDVMFVPDLEWAQFAFFSAGDESEYKGCIRGILLAACAGSLVDDTTTFLYEDEEMLARVSWTLDPARGFKRVFQMRTPLKRGDGYTKRMKSVTPEELQQQFPDFEFTKQEVVDNSPESVVNRLFNGDFSSYQVQTAEQILDIINDTFTQERKDLTFLIADQRFKQLDSSIKLPPLR